MGEFDIKSPTPGLYIPDDHMINQHIKGAVAAERQRVQSYFVERHKLYTAQQNKLNELSLELKEIEVIALYATGQTLENAMKGKTGLLTHKLDEWVRDLRALVNPDELKGYPDVVRWVSAHVKGIQQTDRNNAAYDGGELLRQLGSKASESYNALVTIRDEIDRGGAPTKEWRMLVGQRVNEIKAEFGLTDKGALKHLENEIKFMDDPSEEWLYILSEITRRSGSKRESWIKNIMRDYRKQIPLLV